MQPPGQLRTRFHRGPSIGITTGRQSHSPQRPRRRFLWLFLSVAFTPSVCEQPSHAQVNLTSRSVVESQSVQSPDRIHQPPSEIDPSSAAPIPVGQQGAQSSADVTEWPREFQEDANLFSITFVDSRQGWAVGDRGTILHTQDGGQSWEVQRTPVRCRLESVCFVDGQHGWAVGGWTRPYTWRSAGVVLLTEDGGSTWQVVTDHFLPWLKGVTFSDPKHGFAYGAASAMYPGGCFETHDGGRHWQPTTSHTRGWIDAVFSPQGQAFMIERTGRVLQQRADHDPQLIDLSPESRLPLRSAPRNALPWVMCGNQGLLLISQDQGVNWSRPRFLPEAHRLAEFDWQAIHTVGDHAWVVGVPGTRVLYTNDRGSRWHELETGHSLPLYTVHFSDERHGWAAGALGTILATHDGGKTWDIQRGQNRRLATMGVFGQPEHIPWELVTQLSGGEGHRLAIEVLAATRAIHSDPTQTPAATRLHEAVAQAGGTAANLIQELPAMPPGLAQSATEVKRRWDAEINGDAQQQLVEYLVRQFRIWRPDLVAVTAPDNSGDGTAELTRQIVLEAAEQAADESRYPSQLHAGLPPWRVARVTMVTEEAGRTGYRIMPNRLVTRLDSTVGQLADRARRIVERSPSASVTSWTLLSYHETPTDDADSSSTALSSTVADYQATRRLSSHHATAEAPETDRVAQRQRNLESLLLNTPPEQSAAWQQAIHLATQLPPQQRGELYWSAAYRLRQEGRVGQSFDLLRRLYQEMPDHELSEAAGVELFSCLASEEGAMHWELPRAIQAQQVWQVGGLEATPGRVQPVTFAGGTENAQSSRGVIPAAPSNPLGTSDSLRNRWKLAESVLATLQSRQPDLYFEPVLRFPLAAFQMKQGDVNEAIRFWRSQLSPSTGAAHRSWAASEIALFEPSREPARPVWRCPRTPYKPKLDGRLQDPTWLAIEAVLLRDELRDQDASPSTHVKLAYDEAYLYLAAVCFKPAGHVTPEDGAMRQRDQTLGPDRLQWCFDTDRDGITFWKMAVDPRGWGNDALNHDSSWDPTWHIANGEDESSWTVEIAIPLSVLSLHAPQPGNAWCFGLERVLPDGAWQSWMQRPPVAANPAEFGLLIFE